MKFVTNALIALILATPFGFSSAQSYPTKQVRIITGTNSGATDIVSRLFAAELTKRLGQQFIVDPRPGAATSIAAWAVKKSPADGYTLMGGSAVGLHPLFLKENSLDATKDLQPVTIMALGETFLMVRPELGVTSLKDFVAKAKTTRLKMASPSPNQHALMMVVAKQMGFEYQYVPYKEGNQAVAEVISGECDFTVNALAGRVPLLDSGRLRAIATFGGKRSGLRSEVPTVKEQGVDLASNFNVSLWAPLGTPREVLARLVDTVAQASKDGQVIDKIHALAMVPFPTTPEELTRIYDNEIATYKVANALAGLTPQ